MTTPQGGRRGTSKAQVHEVIRRRLADLQKQAQQLQNAQQGKHQRIWQIPSDYEGSTLDVPNLHNPSFDRESVNEEYIALTTSPENAGTMGDVISLKMQIDYNASEERAFRARHATMARSMCLAHGRRYGQGHGNLWDPAYGVEAAMAAWIAQGGAQPGTSS